MPVLGYSSDDATAPPTALEQPAGPLGYSSDDAIDRAVGSKLPHDLVETGDRLVGPSTASQASGYVSAGGGTTYGDWLQTGKAGLHGAGAALATLAGKAADTPEQTAYWQKQAAAQRAEQQRDVQGMTPAGQQGRAGSFWAHPVQQALEAAPGLAIQGIPAIVGGALAGPPGAIAGAALAGGAYQGASEVSDYTQQIMDAPEETLMKNPDYASLIASGMKPEDARLKFADASSKGLFAKSAAIGALTSVPFAEVGGSGAAKIFGDKLVNRLLAGGLEAGPAMTAQGAAQTQVSGQAGYEAGVRGPPTPEETRQGALAGLETGVQLGPAAALLHGRPGGTGRRLAAKPDETGSEQGRTPLETRAAEAKPRATAGAPTEGVTPAAPAAARAPANPIADPTLRAATGEGVTPESKQPEVAAAQPERAIAPPPQQPTVEQPPPPSQQATEAPPAADTTAPVTPPRPPTSEPAAARPAEAVTPESDATIAVQHAALIDRSNSREAMVYNPGQAPLPLPDATFGQTRLKDGRIVQYDKQGPSGYTPAKLGRLNREGRLNEVLQMGPVNKEEALQRVSAGEQPAAVTTRTPEGVEEKAAAGTAATAPAQVAAQEATKTPGSTVQVESPEPVILAREAAPPATPESMAREVPAQVVTPERAARDVVTPGVTGRVLRPETEAEQAVAAQQLAAQEAVKGVALGGEKALPAGRHWTRGELAKKENANAAANEIMQRHPPGEREQPNDIYRRAKTMVEEAEGIHVPTEVSEEGKHGPGILLLREAKDLLAKDPASKTALGRFLDIEGMIRRGEFREALEARRAGGKESAALGSPEEGGAEGVRPGEHTEELSPEEEIIRREEEEERAKEEPEEISGRWDVPEDASRGDILRKMEAAKAIARDQNIGKEERDNAMRGVERLQEALQRKPEGKERPKIEVKEGEHYTAAKAAAGFKQEVRKSRASKKQEMPAEEARPGKVMTTDEDGNPVEITPRRTMTAREAIAQLYNPRIYSRDAREMNKRLIDKLNKLAGDTLVHFISHDDIARVGGPVYGLYDPMDDHILLNDDYTKSDTMLHELFHAATAKALEADPRLKDLMERLRNDVRANMPSFDIQSHAKLSYALSDPEEFLTGMMTNPDVQRLLKSVRISDELARDINMPRWRKMTMWNGVLDIIRQALGMEPRDVSAIEAAMAITEHTIWKQDAGEMMEAAGRLANRQMEEGTGARSRFQRMAEKTPVDASRSPTRYSEGMDKITDAIKDRIRDVAPAAHGVTERMRNLIDTPRDWMERAKERGWRIASLSERIIDHMGELGADREKILKLSTPVMDRLGRLYNENGNEFGKLARLFVSSTVHGADARDDLGKGLNAHIKVNKKNIENSNLDHWDAIKGNPKDRAEYNAMKPETQALYNDTMNELKAMNLRVVAATREALAAKLQKELETSALPQERKDAIQKIIDQKELTPEEKEKYGDDANIRALNGYDAMAKQATLGAYFPLKRTEGTHFVGGEHDYDLPANARRASKDESSPDYHRIVFDNRKDAFNFNPDLPTVPGVRHYIEDASGKREYVSADEATSVPGAKHGEEYHVMVNNRDVRFVDGNVEGERVRRLMEQEGMKNVSVQPRKNQEVWQYGVNSGHVTSIVRRLDKLDLTDNERANMTDAIKHVAASSMPGSRLSRGFLHRDRTGGAGGDVIASLDRHRRTSAGLEAMAGHRDEIDAAMEKMKQYVDDHPNHKDVGDMRQMVNMYDDRINNFQKDALSDINVNKRWNAVRAYTTLNDLVSPAFFLLHQLHIPLTVFPDLAARHGIGAATKVTLGVYRDMLGAELPMAVKAMGRAVTRAWRYNHRPTDFIDALKNEGKLSANERAMVDWGVDHDFVHGTGIDFSQAYVSARALDKFASKARNFSQEFIGSADAFNKINSALMFHRAALQDGMKGEDAYRYAWDSVARTQGQFTSFQRMGMFRDARMQSVFQYKQYPILMAKTIAKAMYNSLAPGVEWETRARALRTFGLMTLSAGAMSGVQGGTAYPLRLADDLLHLLNITEGWETHMDELRRSLAGSLGAEGATAIMDGLGGLAGIYAGHRGGISDPLGVNYLLETAKGDQDMYKYLAGPPGGLAHNLFSGLGGLMQGDADVAVKNLLPRIATDPIKAYEEYNRGVSTQRGAIISPPVSAPEAIMKALGLTTIVETHAREARAAVGRERTEQQAERQKITQLWQEGDRAGAIAAVHKFNLAYPSQHITVASLSKLQRPTVLGYPETPKNRAQMIERAQAYGLQ